MATPNVISRQTRRCVVCGTYVREGLLCPIHTEQAERRTLELGQVAKFESVRLDSLSVDPRYQRQVNQERILTIKTTFDKRLLGYLTVSRRAHETVILDGQHRWSALVDMGFSDAPCEVFESLSYEDEALIFAHRNRDRTGLRPETLFNALAEGGDERYKGARDILQRFGFRIVQSPISSYRHIRAAVAIMNIYDMGYLNSVLAVIDASWKGQIDAIKGEVLMGVAAFLKTYPEVDIGDLIGSLSQHPVADLLARTVAMHSMARERRRWVHFYKAVVDTYNYKRSARRVAPREIPFSAVAQWVKQK